MKRTVLAPVLLAATPLGAAPGGPIDTMPLGTYVCELPGDASGPVGRRVPEQDFAVLNASSYSAAGGNGTYLLTGDQLAMTSGPKAGQRFHRVGNHTLRRIEADGSDGDLRCVRSVINNS